MRHSRSISLLLILPFLVAFTLPVILETDRPIKNEEKSAKAELEKLPPFEVTLLDSGERLTSRDLRGTYVLIDVWSTSCGICIREVPVLEKVNEKYRDENFEIISIALSKREDVQKFREERYSMSWKHAVAESYEEGERALRQLLKVRGTPTYYFVSPDGKVLADREDFKQAGSFSKIIDRYL